MFQTANIRTRRLILIGLALYLIFFGTFAVFHAYANDELGETTCAIGQWVQQGQAILFGIVLLSITPICLPYRPPAPNFRIRSLIPSLCAARAPPRLIFL